MHYYQKYGHAELAQARNNVDKARVYMNMASYVNSVLVIGVLSGHQKKREVVLSTSLHKDRKSVDRFKHIYLMNTADQESSKRSAYRTHVCFRGWVTPNMHRFYIILTSNI